MITSEKILWTIPCIFKTCWIDLLGHVFRNIWFNERINVNIYRVGDINADVSWICNRETNLIIVASERCFLNIRRKFRQLHFLDVSWKSWQLGFLDESWKSGLFPPFLNNIKSIKRGYVHTQVWKKIHENIKYLVFMFF